MFLVSVFVEIIFVKYFVEKILNAQYQIHLHYGLLD